ncbi:MAG: hypothetical protein KAI66_07230, partial [Lentisphaeria bacterium]|nr:hypothetical protein [Lentisphaeria bacterium]
RHGGGVGNVFSTRGCPMRASLLFFVFATACLASEATVSLVANHGFETVENGAPTSWTIGDSISKLCSDACEGTQSLRIVDSGPKQGSNVLSARFPLPPGGVCSARLKLFLEEGDAQGLGIYLKMWDKDGRELVKPRERQIHCPKMVRGVWSPVTATFNLPAEAVSGAVWLHTFSTAATTCRIDDVRVTTIGPEDIARALGWRGGTLAKTGQGGMAVRWAQAEYSSLNKQYTPPVDWSGFGAIQFTLHSEKATASAFTLIIRSENSETKGMDYWAFRIVLDWIGPRTFELPFRELSRSRSPVGWHQINEVSFTASGWGNSPDPAAVVLLEGFKLVKGGPWRPVSTAVYTHRARGKTELTWLLWPSPAGEDCPVQAVELVDAAVCVRFADGRRQTVEFDTPAVTPH